MTTEPHRFSERGYHSTMALSPQSRAYDPTYVPTKSLAQLVAEHPNNQFFADRLAEQKEAMAVIARGRAWVKRVVDFAVSNPRP